MTTGEARVGRKGYTPPGACERERVVRIWSMSDQKPSRCPQCGAGLSVLKRDAVESFGYAKPSRVDWDFQCSADSSHEPIHWTEYP